MRRAPGSPEPLGEEEKGMPARGLCEAISSCASRAACSGIAFHALAYYEEDTGRQAYVKVEQGDVCNISIVDPGGCDEDAVAAAERALPLIIQAPLMSFSLGCGGDDEVGTRYQGLVSVILSCVREHLAPCMRRLALASREYFAVIGWNGLYAIGPGEERSVTLPLIRSVAFGHTHPGPICYPSWRDIRSFAEYFASGGLVEVVASTSCVYALWLRMPFNENDYWSLEDVAKCMKKAEKMNDIEEYLMCLSRLRSLTSLDAGML